MHLQHALSQIAEIRQQMVRSQVFRGYRSATVAFSGIVAIVAAGIQATWIPDAAARVDAYLILWVTVATVSAAVIGAEMIVRYRRSPSALHREATGLAVAQFLPAVVTGALVTLVLFRFAPESLWMLPGLWAIFCGLGIFASRPMLPRGTALPAGFYLAAGLACLTLARGSYALSPWAMGLTFGLGQLLAAGVLYWTLERDHVGE